MSNPTGICILGSTGSIGTQTLDVVRFFPERFRVVSLSVHSNAELAVAQALEFRPDLVSVSDDVAYAQVCDALHGSNIRVAGGHQAATEAVLQDGVETVVAAIVGYAGLPPVLAALGKGLRVALANKETLVAAGSIVREYADRFGGSLIPVDSEHSAVFQCLQGEPRESVEGLVLTASGGPFRTRSIGTFSEITIEEALRHPNWSMGPKVTVDSATMMNKGLEVIEAFWLFDLEQRQIGVLVHPQSVVHSIVNFVDGSSKAQLGVPDMLLPIQYALSYPERWSAPHDRIDWNVVKRLDFVAPDPARYPCLELAYAALDRGGTHPAALNAANEEAVRQFLSGRIRFVDIFRTIEFGLAQADWIKDPTLEDVHEIDRAVRRIVKEHKGVRVH